MKRIGAILPLLLIAVHAPMASAQQNHSPVFTSAHTVSQLQLQKLRPQEEARSPQDAMSMSGMFLGVVGMIGGAAVASGLKQGSCENSEDKGCLARHAFTGALIAGSAFVPFGVHIANEHRKRLLTSLAVSTLAGAVFYFGTRAIPGEPVHIAPFLAAPVQMVTSIKIETWK